MRTSKHYILYDSIASIHRFKGKKKCPKLNIVQIRFEIKLVISRWWCCNYVLNDMRFGWFQWITPNIILVILISNVDDDDSKLIVSSVVASPEQKKNACLFNSLFTQNKIEFATACRFTAYCTTPIMISTICCCLTISTFIRRCTNRRMNFEPCGTIVTNHRFHIRRLGYIDSHRVQVHHIPISYPHYNNRQHYHHHHHKHV